MQHSVRHTVKSSCAHITTWASHRNSVPSPLFTCNGGNEIVDRKVSASSTLGGDMSRFSMCTHFWLTTFLVFCPPCILQYSTYFKYPTIYMLYNIQMPIVEYVYIHCLVSFRLRRILCEED